jgi:hypothetical protein
VQRGLVWAFPTIDHYGTRLYAINQASLCLCLVLGGALAALSSRPWRTLTILGLGCALHLLLDACEIKWANGVSWWVPFNWRLSQFGLVWPESAIIYSITLFGLAYFLWAARRAAAEVHTFPRGVRRYALSTALLMGYCVLPLLWLEPPARADNHFVATLSSRGNRTGHYVELDRPFYSGDGDKGYVLTFADERLEVDGIGWRGQGRVSIRARFVGVRDLAVIDYHVHHGALRDLASYVGLFLVAALWMTSPLRRSCSERQLIRRVGRSGSGAG